MPDTLTLKSLYSLLKTTYPSNTSYISIPTDRCNEVYINDGRYIKSRITRAGGPIWMLYNNKSSVSNISTEMFLNNIRGLSLFHTNLESIPSFSEPTIYMSRIFGSFAMFASSLAASSQTKTSTFRYNSSASRIGSMSTQSFYMNTNNLFNIDSFDKFNRYLGFVLSGTRLGFGGNGTASENAQTAKVFVEKSNYHVVATSSGELDEYSQGTYFGFDVKSADKYFDEYNNDSQYIKISRQANAGSGYYYTIYANGFDEEQ